MASKFINILLLIFLSLELPSSKAQSWIQAGYWFNGSEFPISNINSALYTHLLYAFADINPSSFELSISSSSNEQDFSNFTNTVKQKNPSITTLLSIAGESANYSVLSSLVSNSSHRKSFIDSSIKFARRYSFQGLDLSWVSAKTRSDMENLGTLFEEWRAGVNSEARNSGQNELILTAAVQYSPDLEDDVSYPADSIQTNLNWIHVFANGYHTPKGANVTGAQAALYDPSSKVNTDFGIRAWIDRGLDASKLVLGLPFYGYAWTLVNPRENRIGAAAKGPAISDDGSMSYKDIKGYIERYNPQVLYNATYVVKYFSVGSSWVGFDDAEVVRIKVSYAKKMKLLGYSVWQVSHDDDNWVLSLWRLLLIILASMAAAIFLVGFLLFFFRKRLFNSKAKVSKSLENYATAAGDFNSNVPNLQLFSLADIKAATEEFSIENKLGEGGYGPVYKGLLPSGQEIAVKKLSKSSTQGFEEFKNEVVLTAKLQHVNLVRVLGFCIERDEQMLIYEYMPNKSLELYLFDPLRRFILDWKKRVEIIEGVTQGLLYLQEYSRLTIIHRDLKASNILLDDEMKPKISDFGMARIFAKDGLEANTDRIVGTYGYVPPEYVSKGVYSTKSDVYSFGVLLLQIISGKKNACFYGSEEDLNLLEYAYELWKRGKGMEFMDPALDDTLSKCKLLKCLQIALLCVEENANDRPSMLEVSSMLKNENSLVKIPKKPAFSLRSEDHRHHESKAPSGTCSVNEITISEEVAR
ncbi:hypothetical protein UlMin_002852 [Ulmus minor]